VTNIFTRALPRIVMVAGLLLCLTQHAEAGASQLRASRITNIANLIIIVPLRRAVARAGYLAINWPAGQNERRCMNSYASELHVISRNTGIASLA
jgi:hypothetical protein